MRPDITDSLDTIEKMMAFEEAFEVDLPDTASETFSGPNELLDWLEVSISNQRPNKAARALLTKLAKDQQLPELGQGLNGPWRREQIAAIVLEFFR
jgi:hypothetical protein